MTPRERAGEQQSLHVPAGETPLPAKADAASKGGSHDSALRGGLWIATSKFVPLAATALLSVTIGRVLGPQFLGLQNLVAFVDAMLATAIQWVLITLSIRLLAEARGDDSPHLDTLTRQAFLLNASGGTLSGLILVAIGLGSDTPLVWLFAAGAAMLNGLAWGYAVSLVAQRGWTPVARCRLHTQLLAALLGITAVWVGAGVAGVFAATAVGSALFLLQMRRIHGPVSRGSLTPLPEELFRVWVTLFVLEVLIQFVAQKSEVLFLQPWAGATAVAMYSVAFMVVASSAALPVAMAVAGLPKVAAAMGEGTLERTLGRLQHPVRVALLMSVPLAACVAGIGPSAVLALYGPEFAPAARIVPAMTLSMLLATGGMVCVTFWVGARRIRIPLVAGVIGVFLDVVLAATLINPLGLWGAVIANVVAQTSMAAVVLVWTHRSGAAFGISWWRWLGLLAFAAAVVGAAHAIAGAVGGDTAGQRWLGVATSAGVTLVLLCGFGAVLGIVDPRDLGWLHSALPVRLRPLLVVVGGHRWRHRIDDSHLGATSIQTDMCTQPESPPSIRAPRRGK